MKEFEHNKLESFYMFLCLVHIMIYIVYVGFIDDHKIIPIIGGLLCSYLFIILFKDYYMYTNFIKFKYTTLILCLSSIMCIYLGAETLTKHDDLSIYTLHVGIMTLFYIVSFYLVKHLCT